MKNKIDKSYHINRNYQPTLKRFADIDGPDFFPTPEWATYALIDNEKFIGDIWEPACGNGAMAEVLRRTGSAIRATDFYNHGYGESGIDFLKAETQADNIITNPPYNCAESFIRKGLELTRHKLALLLRLAFLEGVNRHNTLFSQHSTARVWVFSERITFYPYGAKPKGSGTTAYAWFVWDKSHSGSTELRWLKPGYKAMQDQLACKIAD